MPAVKGRKRLPSVLIRWKRLEIAMRRAHLYGYQLAKLADVSTGVVQHARQRVPISLDSAERIAKALDLDAQELIERIVKKGASDE